MGSQKNRLNETVLLRTQNICLKLWVRKYLQYIADFFVYLNQWVTFKVPSYSSLRTSHPLNNLVSYFGLEKSSGTNSLLQA